MRSSCFLVSALFASAQDLFLSQRSDAAVLSDCDPLVPEHCMLPFPNNFWLRPDGSGRNVTMFGKTTFPKGRLGKHIDAEKGGWNGLSGFSPSGSINAYFEDLAAEGLPPVTDIAQSLSDASPTILIEAATGKRVAHWAELDHHADKSDGSAPKQGRLLMIWPAQRLKDATRYVVAMRGLRRLDDSEVATSEAFAALRDGVVTTNPDVELRRGHFDEDIFPTLKAGGLERSSVQLAFDFTTASSLTDNLLFVRDDGLARVDNQLPEALFNITDVDEDVSPLIARRVRGTFLTPLYVDRETAGAHLVFGDDGKPAFQGWSSRPTFTLLIPRVAEGAKEPMGILQYGHGLFGSQNEVNQEFVQNLTAFGNVAIAVDWWGMAGEDEVTVAGMFARNFENFGIIPQRLTQGVLNALVFMRIAGTEAFQTHPRLQLAGKRVLTPQARRSYQGNSQGGIMGAVYMAMSTEVTRGSLGVAGMPYTLMLPRSTDFNPFFDIMKARWGNPVELTNVFSLIQLLWDYCEPSGYAASLHPDNEPLPGTPRKEMLLQYSNADSQVPNHATLVLARSLGAGIFSEQVPIAPTIPASNGLSFHGLEHKPSPTTSPLVVGWWYPNVVEPIDNVPASEKPDNTHEYTRRQPDAQQMNDIFFKTGSIENTCGGECRGFPAR